MTCEHYKKPCPFAGGSEDGAWVCFHCSKNTAKGQWPPEPPRVQPITVNGGPKPIPPVPLEQWPAWARWIAFRANGTDIGVGDTVARTLGMQAVAAMLKAVGINCGCSARRAEWNAKYTYAKGQ